ncbi:MAG: hypothetical protein ABIQ81_00605, partial [Novosphingobium sp.]
HTGPQLTSLHHEAGQMAASDYVPNLPDLPLASSGASTDGKRTVRYAHLNVMGISISGDMLLCTGQVNAAASKDF